MVHFTWGAYGNWSKLNHFSPQKTVEYMNIEEAKKISIETFLEKEGYKPTKTYGSNLLYHSPLRTDLKASFLVETDKNLWHDNGTGQWGDIIELASLLWGLNVSDTLKRLESDGYSKQAVIKSSPQEHSHPIKSRTADISAKIRNVRVLPLTNVALLSYLRSRQIDLDIGRRYCKELHYDLNGKHYFSIAFPNGSGNYEVRNPYFKGCFGSKDATLLPLVHRQFQDGCLLFEGFMDFLAYLTLQKNGDPYFIMEEPCDFLVMNSVHNRRKCYQILQRYRNIHCFLDNDNAGRKALEELRVLFSFQVTDDSFRYADYKDINDYLMGRKK